MAGAVETTICIVRCPACGRFVRAVVYDGRVKGWCAVQRRYVNAMIEEVVDGAMRRAGKGAINEKAKG